MRRANGVPVIVLSLLGASACSESEIRSVPAMSAEEVKRVFDTHRPQSEKVLQSVRAIQAALAEKRRRTKEVKFDPLPVLRNTLLPDDPKDTNVAILAEETLIDFEARAPLDLKFDYKLTRLLKMTATNAVTDNVYSEFPQEVEDALAVRYMVILRTERYVPALTLPTFDFTPGSVILTAFITDLSSAQVLAEVKVQAESSKSVDYRRDLPQTTNGALEDDLKKNTKRAVMRALAEKTGGRFEAISY